MKKFTLLPLVLIMLVMIGAAFAISAQDDGDPNDDDMLALLNERGVTVLPLEAVTESPAQLLDLQDDSARVNFVGTIPLACTLLYGTSPDFGFASVDANMDGATIIEHNPLMLDLEPDTEYFYRLQGSDVNGTFYVSELMTFRTPAENATPPENLLSPDRGAEVLGVSSNFGGAENDERWGILSAFDGNLNTAWASDGDGDNAWFEVALDGRYQINTVEFQTRLMSDGTSQIFAFTLTSDDGTVYGPYDLPQDRELVTLDVDIVAESLRLDVVSSSGGNTGIDEIAVYGEPVE
ncbi:MAG: discoidin domain-containing protein [Aggregatilineales bacterium]